MRKKLYVLCGIPAAGKDYYLNHMRKSKKKKIVSRDKIRFSFVSSGQAYFSQESLVYKTFINEIVNGLEDYRIEEVYANATHVNKASRKRLLDNIRRQTKAEYDVVILVFNTPWRICLERNEQRPGRLKVPYRTMKRFIKAFEYPTKEENELITDIIELVSWEDFF